MMSTKMDAFFTEPQKKQGSFEYLRDNCLRLPLNHLRDRIEAIRIANMPSCFANFLSFFSELEIVHNLWTLSPWLYPVYPLELPILAGWLPTSRRSIAARKTWSTWQGSPGLRGWRSKQRRIWWFRSGKFTD